MNGLFRNTLWVPACFFGLFLLTIFSRPLLPIDETRYLTVAWEMLLRHDWLAPLTVNGAPYHHKPPLLFWLINSVWSVTGPSRWAAHIPPVIMGTISVYLTIIMAGRLFPRDPQIAQRVPFVMMACLPFLFYSGMIMFDVTMTVFVMLTLLFLLSFSETLRWRYVFLMGLTLGLGVLTKGPVAYLYTLPLMVLGPLWHRDPLSRGRWYAGCLLSLPVSFVPVLVWLVPVLQQSDNHFAFWLLWEQTAGRVTGNFKDAHVRPFYSYIPVIAVLMLPWIFFPAFWRCARQINQAFATEYGVRLVLCWLIPVLIAFSAISGKQPHYLVPLLPGLVILCTVFLRDVRLMTLQRIMAGLMAVFVCAHVVSSYTVLRDYDLMPVARYVQAHPDADWAFVKKYHGEVTFLGRLTHPLDVIEEPDTVDDWFEKHPDGYAIIRYREEESFENLTKVMDMPYRGKRMGVFRKGAAPAGR